VISKAIKVDIKDLAEFLNFLKEKEILDKNLKIKKDGNIAYIPVLGEIKGFEIIETDFEQIKRFKSYKDYLSFPDEVIHNLPNSYDIVGDIIIIKLKDEFMKYAEDVGKALLKFHKNMKTVALDMGVKGELRIRELKVIFGDGLETIHMENGIKIYVNPGKSYFSPRLSSERYRVMQKVRENETIIDMFCGVGPFSLLIAKNKKVKIYAIDKNPIALEYFHRSVLLNKINDINIIQGDIKERIDELPLADRIIMDLPFYSLSFMDYALKKSRKGTILHLYVITDDENSVLSDFEGKFKIIEYGIVHGYSPKENMFYFDLEVK